MSHVYEHSEAKTYDVKKCIVTIAQGRASVQLVTEAGMLTGRPVVLDITGDASAEATREALTLAAMTQIGAKVAP